VSVRLYIPRGRLAAGEVALTPDEAGYLTRVRRLGPGAALEVFDGEGGTVRATLLASGLALALGARATVATARRFSFELWQGLAKGDKLELVVQKATELGAARVVPFASGRSVVKLSAERGAARAARLQKIAAEAARQSGRADVPEIARPAKLADLFALKGTGVVPGLLYERETERGLWGFLRALPDGSRAALAIGPEGGFAPEEIAAAQAAGVAILGLAELGGLVLRTETAAIAVCALAAMAAGEPAGEGR
jgi:16S rRNA (uracil1498-N3)-methyltransferase